MFFFTAYLHYKIKVHLLLAPLKKSKIHTLFIYEKNAVKYLFILHVTS